MEITLLPITVSAKIQIGIKRMVRNLLMKLYREAFLKTKRAIVKAARMNSSCDNLVVSRGVL